MLCLQMQWQNYWQSVERNSGTNPCRVAVNSVFVVLPRKIIEPLQRKYHFYTWNEENNEVRLMCSFNTTEKHIENFLLDLKALL